MHDLQACKNQLKHCNPITDFFMSQNVSDIDCQVFEMWNVWNVRCPGFEIPGMQYVWDAECGMLGCKMSFETASEAFVRRCSVKKVFLETS